MLVGDKKRGKKKVGIYADSISHGVEINKKNMPLLTLANFGKGFI